jgi:hypothetical protein
LPLNISNIIPSTITDTLADIGQPSILETVNGALAEFNPRSIKDCLIISLTFAILSILPDVLCIGFAILNQPEVGPSISWITGPFRIGCSLICCVSLLVPAGILFYILLKAKHLPQEIVMDLGEAGKQILATMSCALFMGIWSIIRICSDHNKD